MLNQLLLQGLNTYVEPVVEKLCGSNKAKEFGVKIGMTAISSIISYALFGYSEGVAKFFYLSSSIIFGSVISDNVTNISQNVKSWISDKLDYYNLDQCMELIDPLLDIGTGVGLRKAAGFSTSLPNFTEWMDVKGAASISIQENTKFNLISAEQSQGWLSKISGGISSIFNLGRSTQYNEDNLLSSALDTAGGYMLLNGVIKFASTVLSYCTSKSSALSMYDIKNILKVQIAPEQYNRAEVQAQANQISAKIQQSEKYYESFTGRPDVQKNIEVVTGVYNKTSGQSMKAQYASVLSSNSKLLEKSEIFVDKLMQTQVTSRLINARESYAKIAQFNEIGIALSEQMKGLLKQAADQQLTKELKEFKATTEEQAAYKNLFSKTAEIELEFVQLSYMMMAMQQQMLDAPEFA